MKNKGHFPTHENKCLTVHYCNASCWEQCRFGVSAQTAYPDVTLSDQEARRCVYQEVGYCTSPDAIKEANQ